MTETRRRYATRLNSFRAAPGVQTVEQMLSAAAQVPGLSAVELNFPQHFPADDPPSLLRVARGLGLEVTALNMRFDAPHFALGAFTNPDASVRDRAVGLCIDAVEIAADHGIGHVIVWPGPDGFDYPFQADYAELWSWEIDGFRRVAGHRPDVRVSLEYKPSDPRRSSLVRTMGDALFVVLEADKPNLGVTFDLCHGLMTGESPAASLAMALRVGKLFGVHLNDGLGPADDGLMVATIHLSQMLEALWYLERAGFSGTYYFDTFPDRVDPAAECARNIATMERLHGLLDRIDDAALVTAQRTQSAVEAQNVWLRALLGEA